MKRVTMKDVAAAAGVGTMTVSYVYGKPERVAEGTREHVREVAERLGYPGPDPAARSLRTGSTGNLGVVMGEHLSYAFDDPQASAFLAGIASVCVENRLGLVLIPSTGEASDVDRVLAAAVDGFVLWTTVDGDPVLDAVRSTGKPASIQGGPGRGGIVLVSPDDRAAAVEIARYALENGRAPLLLSFPIDRERQEGIRYGLDPEEAPYPVTRNRLAGFRDACVAAGLDWALVPVLVVSRNVRSRAEKLVRDALATPGVDFDVVIAMSDELALGALDAHAAAAPHGRSVPVTGWDDSRAGALAGVSSIRQSLREQGVICASIAAGRGTDTLPEPAWELVPRPSRDPASGV